MDNLMVFVTKSVKPLVFYLFFIFLIIFNPNPRQNGKMLTLFDRQHNIRLVFTSTLNRLQVAYILIEKGQLMQGQVTWQKRIGE